MTTRATSAEDVAWRTWGGVTYERESVRTFVPAGSRRWATYVLEDGSGHAVYVGATGQPRVRLLSHLAHGREAEVIRLRYHRNSSTMSRTERALIESLRPEGNSRGGQRHGAWRARL